MTPRLWPKIDKCVREWKSKEGALESCAKVWIYVTDVEECDWNFRRTNGNNIRCLEYIKDVYWISIYFIERGLGFLIIWYSRVLETGVVEVISRPIAIRLANSVDYHILSGFDSFAKLSFFIANYIGYKVWNKNFIGGNIYKLFFLGLDLAQLYRFGKSIYANKFIQLTR